MQLSIAPDGSVSLRPETPLRMSKAEILEGLRRHRESLPTTEPVVESMRQSDRY